LDGITRLWSLSKKTQLIAYSPVRKNSVVSAASAVKTVAFDEARGRIIVGHLNGYIRQYEYLSAKKVMELGLPKDNPAVQAMAVMTRSDLLVFSNENKVVRVWDLSNEAQNSAFSSSATTFLYDGSQDVLFSGTEDGDVHVWKCVIVPTSANNNNNNNNNNSGTTVSTNNTLSLDEVDRNFQFIRKQHLHKGTVTCMFYHPDKDVLVTGSSDKTIILWNDCMKMVKDEMDDMTKESLSRDFDLQVKDLEQEQVIALLQEIAAKRAIDAPKLELAYNERKLCEVIVRALPAHSYKTIKDEIYSKLIQLETKIEEETLINKRLVENSRDNLYRKYQKYINNVAPVNKADDNVTPSNQKSPFEQDLDNMEDQYKRDMQEMKERHARELKQLERKFYDDREKLVKDVKRETQRAAKTFQTVKNTFSKRMKRLDSEIAKQFHDIVTSLNICNDAGNSVFHGIENNYKLVCPLVEDDEESRLQELSATLTANLQGKSSSSSSGSTISLNTTASSLFGQEKSVSTSSNSMPEFRVYKAVDLHAYSLVAIKLYPPLIQLSDELSHETLVPVHEIIYNDYHTFVVMDIMECNLRSHINRVGTLQKQDIASIMFTLLKSVQYLNKAGVVHRELQPDNVFLSFEGKARLFHVGLMKGLTGDEAPYKTGEVFAAPELFGCTVSMHSDMWSLGVLFAHLLQTADERKTKLLCGGKDTAAILTQMVQLTQPTDDEIALFCSKVIENKDRLYLFENLTVRSSVTIANYVSRADADELDLLQKMLHFVPMQRISVENALQHPYFAKYMLKQ